MTLKDLSKTLQELKDELHTLESQPIPQDFEKAFCIVTRHRELLYSIHQKRKHAFQSLVELWSQEYDDSGYRNDEPYPVDFTTEKITEFMCIVLRKINPNWTEDDIENMLDELSDYTIKTVE